MHMKMIFLPAQAVAAREEMDQIRTGELNQEKNGEAAFWTHARAYMHAQPCQHTCSPVLQGRELHLQQNEGEMDHFRICPQGYMQ